jgi:hypothetical protein
MRFVCVYLSRSCYFVLSPPVGMSYFNEICLCFIYPDCVILYCLLQSVCHILMRFVCVYLSRSCYFVLSPPVGMSYFNEICLCFIYPDCVILYCLLQSVCHMLMRFVCVYLSRSCYFVLSPLVGMSYFNGIFCVYLSRSCYFLSSPPVGMSYFNEICLCLSIQIVLFCIVSSRRYAIF